MTGAYALAAALTIAAAIGVLIEIAWFVILLRRQRRAERNAERSRAFWENMRKAGKH